MFKNLKKNIMHQMFLLMNNLNGKKVSSEPAWREVLPD
jgi:hypothetical protein